MFALAKVFVEQNKLIAFNEPYKNELEIIKVLHTMPAAKRQRFKELTESVLQDLDESSNVATRANHSRSLREQGNQVYKTKSKKSGNDLAECLLSASRLYTQAILEAENAYEELCLGFANRAMALQDFGYYEQAYDDCECALEFGYPKNMQHKLIMRQAYCAWKLGDAQKLGEHIACLEQLELNASFTQQLEQLQQELQLLQSNPPAEEVEQAKLDEVKRNNTEISTDAGGRERYMIASQRIKQGEIVFTEQAECFVPTQGRLICQQCAASLLCAPIPCTRCHQRVVYCSRRCRQLHAAIHGYECEAYRRDLLLSLGPFHLALRVVLTYVPHWLPQLRNGGSTATELWQTLIAIASAEHHWPTAPQHTQTLCMMHHQDKADASKLMYCVFSANLLQVYLYKCTNFYEQLLASTAASAEDWHLLLAALLARTNNQLLNNAHVGDAILPRDLGFNEFVLLRPQLWRAPFRLRLGCLHKFDSPTLVKSLNLPYYGLCNHACDPSLRSWYDGRSVSSYAARNIEPGEEIFNCYTANYKTASYAKRKEQLEQTFNFQCSCSKCVRAEPDQDYFASHRYRCEHCEQIFVPAQLAELSWWQESEPPQICCTVCQAPQDFSWHEEFLVLCACCDKPNARHEAYKVLDNLRNWLLDYHSLRLCLAKKLVLACLTAKAAGHPFEDTEFSHLGRIIEYLLAGAEAQIGSNAVEYIPIMGCLFDLIAWGKYKCSRKRLAKMRAKLDYLAGETQQIFVNYYNDFIEPHCK
ncbi:SET and MYND domain-containing protein 4 [Drosophila novamexicana]|uniref:SET and MYND domain-containing protein 4 n=1 Tax=Drosophila novamexicana TaxID=47314 RepID=UPI0011E5D506|nr:SET and MYND domain-containing protein 4 [Drosophila novamexicana]